MFNIRTCGFTRSETHRHEFYTPSPGLPSLPLADKKQRDVNLSDNVKDEESSATSVGIEASDPMQVILSALQSLSAEIKDLSRKSDAADASRRSLAIQTSSLRDRLQRFEERSSMTASTSVFPRRFPSGGPVDGKEVQFPGGTAPPVGYLLVMKIYGHAKDKKPTITV